MKTALLMCAAVVVIIGGLSGLEYAAKGCTPILGMKCVDTAKK